jgi:phosphoglycolate phosphatase
MPERARPYKLLVFDWDGTLADSTAVIVDAIRVACKEAGVTVPTVAQARHVIGLGLADVLSQLAPNITPAQRNVLVERYRHYYFAHDDAIPLYKGTREMLADLDAAGFVLAVATGKSRSGLDRALQLTGLAQRFRATRCADEGQPKPHPGMLLYLMDELAMQPAATLMIGDTTHDLDLAANAGVASLGISHGAHDDVALATRRPQGIVHSTAEMRRWLLKGTDAPPS